MIRHLLAGLTGTGAEKHLHVQCSLFAEPSFVEGVARVIDLGATLQEYNYSNTEKEADAKALYRDWLTVGQDLWVAIEKHDNESIGKQGI